MIIQCCQCKKVKQGETWKEPPPQFFLQDKLVSHTYCPACAEQVLHQIRLCESSQGVVSAVV